MAEIAFDDLDYEPETIGDLDSFILGDFDIKPASFLPRLKSDHPTLESGSKKRGGLKGRSKNTNVKSNKESRNLHKHHHGGTHDLTLSTGFRSHLCFCKLKTMSSSFFALLLL